MTAHPPEIAEALRLRLEGVPIDEVAARLGHSRGWVSWAVEVATYRGAPRTRTPGERERYLVRRGLIP